MKQTQLEAALQNEENAQARDLLLAALQIQQDLRCNLRNLARDAATQAERLTRLAQQAAAYDTEADYLAPTTWNGLGEDQGNGNEIDRLCGTTRELVKALALINKVIAATK